ncbi:MAG TPA: serpin family protein [Candidatus Binataceae bacterium]|nr:serpin family protein [Candidatus Binataceae bacterium]
MKTQFAASKVLLVAIMIVALGGALAADPAEGTGNPGAIAKVASADNDFGFRLLRTLTDGTGGNVIISPLSVSMALAMTYNGAAGETKAAMAKTLGIAQIGDEEVNQGNRDLLDSLKFNRINTALSDVRKSAERAAQLHLSASVADLFDIFKGAAPPVQVEIANAIWTQSGYSINPAFLKMNREYYDSPVEALDFKSNPKGASDRINSWTNKNTGGKIPSIIERIDPVTRLALTDAVYFKGRWTNAFDSRLTKPGTFHLLNGSSVEVPMMTQLGEYSCEDYFPDRIAAGAASFGVLRLPYGSTEQFAMYIFLPHEPNGLPRLIPMLDERHWREWTSNLRNREGGIILPRFESNYGTQLSDALKTMGMDAAFDEVKADFSRIHSAPLFISDVEHKTYLKVDEEGTEAAAATVALATMGSSCSMEVDHPFFFAIADRQSGAILFAGVVTNPAK